MQVTIVDIEIDHTKTPVELIVQTEIEGCQDELNPETYSRLAATAAADNVAALESETNTQVTYYKYRYELI